MEKKPIGIFDSGVGGLTVYREIRKKFPYEDIIYFGDTARVPYGPKSPQTVIQYSWQNARFLLQQGAKIIVVACNTSSAVALEFLKRHFAVPVIGVIEPGTNAAIEKSLIGRIGIIGTEGTIRSNAYLEAIAKKIDSAEVFSSACPLFVPLAEEGWINHPVTKMTIREYLQPFISKNIDTLILGCTHYPILKPAIRKFLGNEIKLVDSAIAISNELKNILPDKETESLGKSKFFVSDNEEKFNKIASLILKHPIEPIKTVKLGESWYIE